MHMKNAVKTGLLMAAALLIEPGSGLADTIILKNGNQVQAKSVRFVASRKEYSAILMNDTQMPFPAANVERVVVPKPPTLDAAAASVRAGKFDAAIAPLEAIINDYNGLEWDFEARDLLGQALIGKKEGRKAVSLYKEILENRPAERISLGVRRNYWEALKTAEMYNVLKSDLEKVIAGPSREMAALAQLLRGDMYLAQGQKNEALYDYLRTVILYEKVQEIRPEALFKAAKILEELRDPRSADLKRRLGEEYPNSDYAKMIKAG